MVGGVPRRFRLFVRESGREEEIERKRERKREREREGERDTEREDHALSIVCMRC